MKDYYKILAVGKYATQDEIKSAYRAAVRKWHPDTNKSPEAHEKIIEINEAYEVLSDVNKRYFYDDKLNRPQYHYQPPPTQPRPQQRPQGRPTYKQREEKESEPWWPYARIPVIILWVIVLIVRNVNCNNKPDYDITDFKYRIPTEIFIDVDSVGNTLDINNIDIDGSIVTAAPFLVYENTTNGIIFSSVLNQNLNKMRNQSYTPLDSINTIVVYDYIFSGDDKLADKTDNPEIGAKVYFINPKTNTVYKTHIIYGDSTSILPGVEVITKYIIQESIN